MTSNRAPRVYTPPDGWRLARWLLLYLAMIVLDAAAILIVIQTA